MNVKTKIVIENEAIAPKKIIALLSLLPIHSGGYFPRVIVLIIKVPMVRNIGSSNPHPTNFDIYFPLFIK
jgi:hypothetical protein